MTNNKNFGKKTEHKSAVPMRGGDTSWGTVASWYDKTVEDPNNFQTNLILPNLMRLMDIKKDECVLDMACGQGFFSRELAKAGAAVSASDISSELIAIAKERSLGMAIEYFIAPASKQQGIKDSCCDKAVCVLALQDMADMPGAIKEVSRILKPGGIFCAVINHPAFRIPKRSAWSLDEKTGVQFRRVDEYMSESRVSLDVHPGTSEETTTYFHRPLQSFFKAFEKAGFVVTRLEEWTSNKESQPGPKADIENKARREFPLFMAVQLRKN
jgi:ubiquinone/menaquinone biosynthesis C-methylase UbiE